MAENPRARKIADRIHEITVRALEHEVRDPRLGFVTITAVRMTGDLQHASIFYTVYGTDEEREAARLGLQKLPRNASPVRVRKRDAIDGRPRGHVGEYGISRVRFRDMAHRGELPGVTKSSW